MNWISVKEKLPEFGVDVLVYMAGTKNVYSKVNNLDYSEFSNYEAQILCMRLFQRKSSKQGSQNGLYWNFEKKGNAINHRNDRSQFNLITHWMPLPTPPTEAI